MCSVALSNLSVYSSIEMFSFSSFFLLKSLLSIHFSFDVSSYSFSSLFY